MSLFNLMHGLMYETEKRDSTSAGNVGERTIKIIIDNTKTNHRLINNLILFDENDNSHQIDHVYISNNGIFCIETKNYKGLIQGRIDDNNWIQILNKKKYIIMNPIKQNNSHIIQISNILKCHNLNYKVNSLIVMVNNNANEIKENNVINVNDLRNYLINYKDDTIITNDDINKIYDVLCASNTKISNKEHVSNIRQTQRNINEGICPRCGKSLVLRNGKYGNFYGCSNYPKCKFTLNIK